MRTATFIRDPVERVKVSSYLRHRLKIADERLRRLRLTEAQKSNLDGEYHALRIALHDLCDEMYVNGS